MRQYATLLLGVFVPMLLAGCASSPASRFYTLSPVQAVAPPQGANAIAIQIAIDPVTVPELVDRPQIVSRLDANRVSINEFARWAEPLKSQIPRVLAADLTRLMPGAMISTYPQRVDDDAYRVSIDVQSFDSSADGTVTLAVIWSVRAPKGARRVNGRSVVREAASAPGYDALIEAHSRALASVARDVAVAAQSLLPS